MYVRHAMEELYDLASDPGETQDLSGNGKFEHPLEVFRAECAKTFSAGVLQSITRPTSEPTAKELEALKGLGYIGGGMPPPAMLQSADIRKVCRDYAGFEAVRKAYVPGRDPRPLLDAYGEILTKYPRAMPYHKDRGILLLQLGDSEAALQAFDRAARLNPSDPAVLVNLGGLYLLKGDAPRAKALFEAALSMDDNIATAHKNLGTIYAEYLKDPGQAVAHYKRYLQLGPDSDAQAIRNYIQRETGDIYQR